MRKHTLLALTTAVVLCSAPAFADTPLAPTAPAEAPKAPATGAPTDPMTFARGAKAWAETCNRCHNMRDAKDLRDDQWRASMAHMRVRAHLTAQEARDIERFLQGSN